MSLQAPAGEVGELGDGNKGDEEGNPVGYLTRVESW
jgi:hypothetical protein